MANNINGNKCIGSVSDVPRAMPSASAVSTLLSLATASRDRRFS